jgi:hypothetical protein
MPFPTTEQYQEAMQFPSKVLKDAELAACTVETSGIGLPFPRSGGFAITYKLMGSNRNWALRVFHKDRTQSRLAERYGAVERGIKRSGLPYFVDFKFLVAGISIQTQTYPCVKMEWADGVVLGTYIEKNKSNSAALQKLRLSIQKLSKDMEAAGIAHGDLQTDNLLVAPNEKLKFVDYDAFFVPEISGLGAIEEGYPNFQHPQRRKLNPYDSKLDRFSYIVIDSALNALIEDPNLWNTLSADPQGLLVRASDFQSPHTSKSFHALAAHPKVGNTYRRLAALCEQGYQNVPTLSEFLTKPEPLPINLRPIPKTAANVTISTQASNSYYQSIASRVLSAANYSDVLKSKGQFVEMVGQVSSVDTRPTKYGKPKVFLIFGSTSGQAVYIPIWAEGVKNLNSSGKSISTAAKGKWVSVTGILDSQFSTSTWSRIGITVVDSSQINFITEDEARFRLAAPAGVNIGAQVNNAALTNAQRNAQIAAAAKKAASGSSSSSRSNYGRNNYSNRRSSGSRSRRSSTYRSNYSTPSSNSGGEVNWILWGVGIFVVLIILL